MIPILIASGLTSVVTARAEDGSPTSTSATTALPSPPPRWLAADDRVLLHVGATPANDEVMGTAGSGRDGPRVASDPISRVDPMRSATEAAPAPRAQQPQANQRDHSVPVPRLQSLGPPAGEWSSPSVEARLLTDPNVLWVGTWDQTDWETKHGVGSFFNRAHTAVGSFSGVSTNGGGLRGRTPANVVKGFDYHASFLKAGTGFPEQEEIYFRYRVFFPKDYVWQNPSGGGHGKLPGLAGKLTGGADWAVGAGGKRWKGTTEVTANNLDDADGWSARLMWHKDRGLGAYLYAQSPLGPKSQNSYFGAHARCKVNPYDSTSANKLFNAAAWNTVEMRIKLNTPGANNGLLQVWMNGELCLNRSQVQYRSAKYPNLKITQQYMSWFYGGPTSDAPHVDSYLYFDDAVISKAYIGPRVN